MGMLALHGTCLSQSLLVRLGRRLQSASILIARFTLPSLRNIPKQNILIFHSNRGGKSDKLENIHIHIITKLLRSTLVITMPSESPLPPELAKQLKTISLNWDLPKIDCIPPFSKSPSGSPVAGIEAESSRPPSPDMTVSPDMLPVTRTNTKCVVTWDLPPLAKQIKEKPVPLSEKGTNHSTPTAFPGGELRLIKGYPIPPPPKFVENRPPGFSEASIKSRERSASKTPLSSNDTASIRDFVLSIAPSPPKEASSSNRKSVSFAQSESADSASALLDPPPSPPLLALSSLSSERAWRAHDLPKIETKSPPSRIRHSKSLPRSPPRALSPSPSSPNLQIIKQPIPKPYRGQELSVVADLNRDHLPHVNHSNCHGSLHLFSVPTMEEFKNHKIVVTLEAGSSAPTGARIFVFKFRIMTLGLYKAVVRLNLVHLGDTVTEEEIETNGFEV